MAYASTKADNLKCPKCGGQIRVIELQDKIGIRFECEKCGEVKSVIIDPNK